MIYRYRFGRPFNTEAVVEEVPVTVGDLAYGSIRKGDWGLEYSYTMGVHDCIYGLGENVRGINKRGFEYISDASDDPNHLETTRSLYGGHNFILIAGEQTFAIFVDCPSRVVFDLGYGKSDAARIFCEDPNLDLYIIDSEATDPAAVCDDIVHTFRGLVGRSYIPPKFAFGFGQSRWGYKTADDFRKVAREHRAAGVPIDMIYMDIDYMDRFKDFTVNPEEYPDFPAFVQEMKEQNIRLIPIIDAGVKIEPGYDVYDEGVKKGFFCKRADGSEFTACVWPGYTHFPDVLNPEARAWFGSYYQRLTDAGIEGFWNDMCEPAIFFTPESLAEVKEEMQECLLAEGDQSRVQDLGIHIRYLPNRHSDYKNMFHKVNGEMVCHEKVHNLFGFGMTRAAGEAFDRFAPGERKLIFSRSSYIGAHRYGGIWMGDNMSWWSHLKMNLAMLPSLNMCGFLYTGADLCGFGCDTTRDLALRWLALGVFTPLMRNHACMGTREQEFYQFEGTEDFRHVIGVRYRLIPYLYSTYMKAALNDEMIFRPLGFLYPKDALAREVEDQLFLGEECMIAPVVQQNTFGRVVYLPEEMMFVKFLADGTIVTEVLSAGHHYVNVELNEVPLFLRKGKAIPVADPATCVAEVDESTIRMIGYEGAAYQLYSDDGVSKDYMNDENYRWLI